MARFVVVAILASSAIASLSGCGTMLNTLYFVPMEGGEGPYGGVKVDSKAALQATPPHRERTEASLSGEKTAPPAVESPPETPVVEPEEVSERVLFPEDYNSGCCFGDPPPTRRVKMWALQADGTVRSEWRTIRIPDFSDTIVVHLPESPPD